MGRLSACLFVVGVISLAACAQRKSGDGEGEVDAGFTPEPCTTLGCFIVDCAAKGLPPTSLSGTVYAPNGTLPLYGVDVYVPAEDPGALPEGATCARCADGLLGGAYTSTKTDEAGHFVLQNVPATDNVPLVIQTGKWRRQITLPVVSACQDLPLGVADTHLPKNKTEGDMPRIAITTGNADALECLPRKLGIDDAEFTTNTGDGRVNLFAGNGTNKFAATHPTGAVNFPNATTLWSSVDELKKYDMVFLSCEGGQTPNTKPQAAIDAMVAYANLGGRMFASHWHNIWVSGDQRNYDANLTNDGVTNTAWSSIATFNFAATQDETNQKAIIDETVPKGMSFAKWLDNVGATPTHAEINIQDPRYIIQTIDNAKAERWVYFDPTKTTPLNKTGVQDFLFTTPVDVPVDSRCGKVVFSDMHVSKGSTSNPTNVAFPGTGMNNGCSTGELTPQEKALAFIFFDIASCVGSIE